MKILNPDKLFVEYRDNISETFPIIPRLYTLTHSDETGELFLTIGNRYAEDKINPMRDEVLAEWIPFGDDDVFLYVNVLVDGTAGPESSKIKNKIFIRELPLALKAIRYGDRKLFNAYPELDNAPIFIRFNSVYPEFKRTEYWGSISDYIDIFYG